MNDNTEKPSLKSRLANLTMVPLAGIDFTTIPENPGVSLLRHKGTWAYIGESDDLRRRIRQYVGTGQSLTNSPLRKSLCEFLKFATPEQIKSGQMNNRTRTLERLDAWILECEIGWLECDVADLTDTRLAAIRNLKPKLNKI